MKKILLLICVLFLITGCGKTEVKEEKKVKVEKTPEVAIEKEVDTYKDLNTTPIGIYKLNGNKLTKVHTITEKNEIEKVIGMFQLYPSNEEEVILNKGFGQSFHDEWIKYNNIKMGFNIKFTKINGEKVSYNIYGPDTTFDQWEYLMNYLYDDYNNQFKSFYSHIESNEVTPDTLYTSFKMQASYSSFDINSKIEFSVFTFDSEDDFVDNEYRGNSIYTMNLCLEGKPC